MRVVGELDGKASKMIEGNGKRKESHNDKALSQQKKKNCRDR